MIGPKKTAYKKIHKGRLNGIETNWNLFAFGDYALQALDNSRITLDQLEACRKAIKRKMNRSNRLWIRVFPDLAVSAKPLEIRMGKGKGAFSYWACRVKSGMVLFELKNISYKKAIEIFNNASYKLPIATRVIKKII